jgi:hypothetical protein
MAGKIFFTGQDFCSWQEVDSRYKIQAPGNTARHTPEGKTMTTAADRHQKKIKKLSGATLADFGKAVVPPVPGTAFEPRNVFLDPGKLPALLKYWANRARRDGCGDGLPRNQRKAACENAAQVCLTYFMDADYRALGITAAEVVRAILISYRLARRRFWRDASEHRDRERERAAQSRGAWFPYNRAQNSRTADPARLWHAADTLGMSPAVILDGQGMDDIPGDIVTVPGGPSGRGETDGRMVCITIRDQAVNVNGGAFCRARLELNIVETRWRMKRGRGKARRLQACTVNAGQPANRGKYRQPAPGPQIVPNAAGARSMVPAMASDVETYRALLAEYYSGR